MKKTFTALILSFLSLILAGCDSNGPTLLEKKQSKIVESLKLKIREHDNAVGFTQNLKNFSSNQNQPPENAVNNYSRLYRDYSSLINICYTSEEARLYYLYSEPRAVYAQLNCMEFIEQNFGYKISSIADILDSALKQSSVDAFIQLYSYQEKENTLTTEMVKLKSKYINTLIKLTDQNSKNDTLLYLYGLEQIKGKYVLKNIDSGIVDLHKAWLLGNRQAPRSAAMAYGNIKDYKNAYLWSIRCIKECIGIEEARNLPRLNDFSYRIYLDNILDKKTIYEIQEISMNKDIYKID